MANDQDQHLQTLFKEAARDLDDGQFTDQVVKRTRKMQFRIMAGGVVIALVLVASAWIFNAPFQAFSLLVSKGLATPLIEIGELRLAWLLAPINNIASLLVLIAKILRMLWKKAASVSYI